MQSRTERTTILFFDDWPLDVRDHLERRIGTPQPDGGATYTDPHLNVTWGYPSVFRTADSGMWRCLYQGWDPERRRLYPLLAESSDGRRWHAADLSAGHRPWKPDYPNQVLPVDHFQEWSPCYIDPHADADERVKALIIAPGSREHFRSELWTSGDGAEWTRKAGVEWQRTAPDPISCVFWNPVRNSYVLTTRPDLNDRRISLVETRDWIHFTEPELALECDALDLPLAEAYGMPVFPYEGMFIGLLWIYHVPPDSVGPMKFSQGKLNSYLTYSRNGWHFQRTLRQPFLENTEPGTLGAGCLQPACILIDEAERIRIYSSASKHEHGVPVSNDGAIMLHTLRRDGFIYLQPTGGPGVLGTRPLLWRADGQRLEINANAEAGEVRVQLTDTRGAPLEHFRFEDSIALIADDPHWTPHWVNGHETNDLSERTLRIEMELINARLYAIRGPFDILTGAETRRFEQFGERPARKKGL